MPKYDIEADQPLEERLHDDASGISLRIQQPADQTEAPASAAAEEIVGKLLALLATTDVHIGPGGGRRTHRLIVPAEGDVRGHLLETLTRALA